MIHIGVIPDLPAEPTISGGSLGWKSHGASAHALGGAPPGARPGCQEDEKLTSIHQYNPFASKCLMVISGDLW